MSGRECKQQNNTQIKIIKDNDKFHEKKINNRDNSKVRVTSTGKIFHGKINNNGNNKDFSIKKIPIPIPIRRVSSLECDDKNILPSMTISQQKNCTSSKNLSNVDSKYCSNDNNYHVNDYYNNDDNNIINTNSIHQSQLELQLQQKNAIFNSCFSNSNISDKVNSTSQSQSPSLRLTCRIYFIAYIRIRKTGIENSIFLLKLKF